MGAGLRIGFNQGPKTLIASPLRYGLMSAPIGSSGIVPGGQIVWPAGYHALSNTIPFGQANSPDFGPGDTYSGSAWQAEVASAYLGYTTLNVNRAPTVLGYAFFATWGGLEVGTSGPGTYQFQGQGNSTYFIDQLMNDCRSKGLKVWWILNPNLFTGGSKVGPSGTNPTGQPAGVVPNYILTNSSLYGTRQLGSNGGTDNGSNPATSGFDIQLDGGWSALLSNSNVRNALLAMVRQIALCFDGDPAFAGIIWDAWDVMYPDNGCAAQSTFWSDLQTLYLTSKSYFKKSNVIIQGGFGTSAAAQALTQTCIQAGIPLSASDTGGINLWAATCLPLSAFGFTNVGSSSSGTFTIGANAYSSGIYNLKLSTGQLIAVSATYTGSGSNFTWSATTTVSGSPVVVGSSCSYFPANANQSVKAYLNISDRNYGPGPYWNPPTPPLYSYAPFCGLFEAPDLNSGGPGTVFPVNITTLQAVQAANTPAPGGYGTGLFFLAIGPYWNAVPPGGTQTDLQVLAANPLLNTSAPAVYG